MRERPLHGCMPLPPLLHLPSTQHISHHSLGPLRAHVLLVQRNMCTERWVGMLQVADHTARIAKLLLSWDPAGLEVRLHVHRKRSEAVMQSRREGAHGSPATQCATASSLRLATCFYARVPSRAGEGARMSWGSGEVPVCGRLVALQQASGSASSGWMSSACIASSPAANPATI